MKYLFNDFVNLVKFDNYLLNNIEFVNLMFIQGRAEKRLKLEGANCFYQKQLAIHKDINFAKYASQVHFILQCFT